MRFEGRWWELLGEVLKEALEDVVSVGVRGSREYSGGGGGAFCNFAIARGCGIGRN